VFDIVLFEPEIPPNTGNALRLAANAGARLHLVRPLGFTLEHRQLTRAGLHYADVSSLRIHEDWNACATHFTNKRMFFVTTRGRVRHDAPQYQAGDVFVFGPETRGLPQDVLASLPSTQHVRIPMRTGNRSLNLSNAIAVVVYEAWRQHDFGGER
jgi:tRNA (cytidine/uridine-2'-O-)-methyltransferase